MRRPVRHILMAVAASFLVVCACVYVFRDVLATGLIGEALTRSAHVQCTRPKVRASALLDRVTIGELRCSLASGPIRSADTEGQTVIELMRFGRATVHIPKLSLDQRERDVSYVATESLADLSKINGMAEPLLRAMLDASELYSPRSPALAIAELTVTRAGQPEAVLRDFRKAMHRGKWDRCQAAHVELQGHGAPVAIHALDLRVTPTDGTIAARVHDNEPGRRFSIRVEGQGLDRNRPHFSVRL